MSTWGDWTDHWKSQLKRHEKEYEVAALATTTLLGGSTLAAAYLAVKKANATQDQIDAVEAAKKSLAQAPISTEQSVKSSLGVPNIGATGTLQFSEGVKAYILPAMAFILALYLLFKD